MIGWGKRMYRKKTTIVIAMCIATLIMAVGYALLSTQLNINGSTAVTSTWKVEFSAIRTVELNGGATNKITPFVSGTLATFEVDFIQPGDFVVYEIDITNYGDIDAEIQSATYSLDGSEAIYMTITGARKGTLLESCENLDVCNSTTLTLKVGYDSSYTTTPENKTSKISVTINVGQYIEGNPTEDGELIPEIVYRPTLVSKILSDNKVFADNTSSDYVSSSTGIDFSKVSSSTNGQGLYYTNKNTDGGKTTYYFRGNVDNNFVALGEKACIASLEHYGTGIVVFDGVTSESECNNVGVCYDRAFGDHTLATESECQQKNIDDGMPDDGPYLYVKGGVWGPSDYWQIIRINEDRSIRIIKLDSVDTISDLDVYANDIYKNYTSRLDNWYKNNSAKYSKYITNYNNFCFDDSWSGYDEGLGPNGNGYYEFITYGASERLVTNKNPMFGCGDGTEYNSPVGLITADEIAYVGGVYRKQYYSYLTEYRDYSTILTSTPKYSMVDYDYSGDIPYTEMFVLEVWGTAQFTEIEEDVFSNGPSADLYPVINLKPEVVAVTGNGTANNPYQIALK